MPHARTRRSVDPRPRSSIAASSTTLLAARAEPLNDERLPDGEPLAYNLTGLKPELSY